MGGDSYSSDTLPVDDDAFLNGGSPNPTPAPAPAPAPVAPAPAPAPEPVTAPVPAPTPAPDFVPGEAKIVKKGMLATNDAEPKEEPAPAEEPTPAEEATETSVPPKAPEVIEDNKPETAASKEVTIKPSATFEEEMKEESKDPEVGASGNMIGQPLDTQKERTRPEHHQMSHVAGITPSQSMIPDGMLADNRISLDDDGEEESHEEHHDSMIPSQAMAETFTANTELPATLHGDLPEPSEAEEESAIDDDEPIVVGPVISSAGVESLSEKQSEGQAASAEPTTMKIEAQINEDEIPDDLKGGDKPSVAPDVKPLAEPEEKPAEKPAEEAKPAEEKPADAPAAATATAEVEPKAEEKPAEAKPVEETKPAEEKPAEEKPVDAPAPEAKPEEKPAEKPAEAPAPKQTIVPANRPKQKMNPTTMISLAIAGLILVVGIIIGIVVLISNSGQKEEEEVVVEEKTSFLLPNDDGRLAVFSFDGDRLTDFKYEEQYSLYESDEPTIFHHIAIVKDADTGEIGGIDTEGNIVIEFGEYSYISYVSNDKFIYALGLNNDAYYLNNEGKIFFAPEDGVILGAGNDSTFMFSDGKAIKLINSDKKELWSEECNKKCPKKQTTSAYYTGNLLYFNGTHYIFDTKNGNVLYSFKADSRYSIRYADNDSKTYYLEKSTSETDDYGYTVFDHKFIVNGKVVQPKQKCTRLLSALKNDDKEHFTCMIGSSQYWLNDDLSIGAELIDGRRSVIDGDHYAEINSPSGLKFFANGKQIRKIDKGVYKFPLGSTVARSDVYIVQKKCEDKECENADAYGYVYQYYTAEGKLMSENNYFVAEDFNARSNLAIAASKASTYFLIDKNGKRVSEEYSYINTINGFKEDIWYSARSNREKRTVILKKNGKVFAATDTVNGDPQVMYAKGKMYYSLANSSKTAMVFDEENTQILKKRYKDITLTEGCIVANDDVDETDYYTYSGKKFHTKKYKYKNLYEE